MPYARRSDPVTSHLAADTVRELTETQARILALFANFGDLTDEELARHWAVYVDARTYPLVSPSGLRSRRKELVDAGRLMDTGARGVTVAGRASNVWGLSVKGLW